MRALLTTLMVLALTPSVGRAGNDSFAIVNEDATATSRVVSVRIERRMIADDLARIAGKIKSSGSNTAIRHTVVSFYLPGMPLEQRPWASVDTTPATKVAIGGLSVEDERALSAEAARDRRQLLGAWLTEMPAQPGRISIFTDKGKTYLEWAQRSGSKTLDEVQTTRGTRGSRFEIKGGGSDYYLLKATGDLEIRSADRLIATAEQISMSKAAALVVSSATAGAGGDDAFEGSAIPPKIVAKPVRKTQVARRGAAKAKRPSWMVQIDYMKAMIVQ